LFLVGGFISFALGAAIAAATGHAIDVCRYVLGQAAVTSFQLMTHYANDYFDVDADHANVTPTRWSGGSRVLVDGVLPRVVALIAACVLAAIGVALAVVLIVTTADPAVAATLVAIGGLAWMYSAPPRLCARGLGELDTALVVTVLVPWLGYLLQAPDLRGGSLLGLSIVSPALLQTAMLLAVEFPDAISDAATGKRTLVVRLGAARAMTLFTAIVVAAFIWPVLAYRLVQPARVAFASVLIAPIALWRIAPVDEGTDGAAHGRFALFGVALFVALTSAELGAWLTL
jgi:1,4-dihydroxy-2-naphthoate octaprenyltransferase